MRQRESPDAVEGSEERGAEHDERITECAPDVRSVCARSATGELVGHRRSLADGKGTCSEVKAPILFMQRSNPGAEPGGEPRLAQLCETNASVSPPVLAYLLDRASLALHQSEAVGHDERLSKWMRMPGSARAWLEGRITRRTFSLDRGTSKT